MFSGDGERSYGEGENGGVRQNQAGMKVSLGNNFFILLLQITKMKGLKSEYSSFVGQFPELTLNDSQLLIIQASGDPVSNSDPFSPALVCTYLHTDTCI